MKKRDSLLEVIRKEKEFGVLAFLQPQDLLALALLSKKYYAQLVAALEGQRLDAQQTAKQPRSKPQKGRAGKARPELELPAETEVEIEKVPLHKFGKRWERGAGEWRRVEQLEPFNSYLAKKLDGRAHVFYRNSSTNELVFLNRSLVDPALNYNKGGFGEDFLPSALYEHIFTEGQVAEQDFSSMEAILKRQREILQKIEAKKEEERRLGEVSFEDELARACRVKRLGLILCFGGSFSFGIFEGGRCVLHRSDRKYVCRQKAGERQFNRDKQAGTQIQSIGSQIRREQEKKHVINVGEILRQNREELAQCELIFLQAPGLNRLFVINENENLDGLQDRLRSVCLTARKANFTEVEALFEAISQVHVVRYLSPEEARVKAKQRREK